MLVLPEACMHKISWLNILFSDTTAWIRLLTVSCIAFVSFSRPSFSWAYIILVMTSSGCMCLLKRLSGRCLDQSGGQLPWLFLCQAPVRRRFLKCYRLQAE